MKLIPICVGEHEPGDPSCDGNEQSGAEHERRPCAWRSRCRGFQAHLEATGEDAERYIQVVKLPAARARKAGVKRTAEPVGMDYAGFARLCDAAALLHAEDGEGEDGSPDVLGDPAAPLSVDAAKPRGAIRSTLAGGLPAAAPSRGTRQKRGLSPSQARKKRQADKWAAFSRLASHFHSHLAAHLAANGVKLHPPRSRQLIMPGVVYRKTNKAKTRATYYVGGPQGNDPGLVRLVYRSQTDTVDVLLSADVRRLQDVMGRKTYMKMDPEPAVEGWFRTQVSRADKERLAIVADAIGRLLAQGTLELPGKL